MEWPEGGRIPRYKRARRSRVIFTRRWHFHWYRQQRASRGVQSGLTLKHRRSNGLWVHVMIRVMKYGSVEKGCGTIRHYELSRHLSGNARGDRVRFSKRYLRFKMCLWAGG
jgi:hypothetical protein